jgi:hypothetical protein
MNHQIRTERPQFLFKSGIRQIEYRRLNAFPRTLVRVATGRDDLESFFRSAAKPPNKEVDSAVRKVSARLGQDRSANCTVKSSGAMYSITLVKGTQKAEAFSSKHNRCNVVRRGEVMTMATMVLKLRLTKTGITKADI